MPDYSESLVNPFTIFNPHFFFSKAMKRQLQIVAVNSLQKADQKLQKFGEEGGSKEDVHESLEERVGWVESKWKGQNLEGCTTAAET